MPVVCSKVRYSATRLLYATSMCGGSQARNSAVRRSLVGVSKAVIQSHHTPFSGQRTEARFRDMEMAC